MQNGWRARNVFQCWFRSEKAQNKTYHKNENKTKNAKTHWRHRAETFADRIYPTAMNFLCAVRHCIYISNGKSNTATCCSRQQCKIGWWTNEKKRVLMLFGVCCACAWYVHDEQTIQNKCGEDEVKYKQITGILCASKVNKLRKYVRHLRLNMLSWHTQQYKNGLDKLAMNSTLELK